MGGAHYTPPFDSVNPRQVHITKPFSWFTESRHRHQLIVDNVESVSSHLSSQRMLNETISYRYTYIEKKNPLPGIPAGGFWI